jgi:hypothetical protein
MFRQFIKETEEEVESSHIRMSSNDDVGYAIEVIDTLLDKLREIKVSPKNPPQLKDRPVS